MCGVLRSMVQCTHPIQHKLTRGLPPSSQGELWEEWRAALWGWWTLMALNSGLEH